MIYIYRFLWLIGYIPVFILDVIMFILLIFIDPLINVFYFIKTGNSYNTKTSYIERTIEWIHEKYGNLLNKIG